MRGLSGELGREGYWFMFKEVRRLITAAPMRGEQVT